MTPRERIAANTALVMSTPHWVRTYEIDPMTRRRAVRRFGSVESRVLGVLEGYVIARHPGAAPYIKSVNEFVQTHEPAQPTRRAGDPQ